MIGVLSNDSALKGYIAPGTTLAIEMNFVMNHAPGAGSIVRPVHQQSSALSRALGYGCSPRLQGCNIKEKLFAT